MTLDARIASIDSEGPSFGGADRDVKRTPSDRSLGHRLPHEGEAVISRVLHARSGLDRLYFALCVFRSGQEAIFRMRSFRLIVLMHALQLILWLAGSTDD